MTFLLLPCAWKDLFGICCPLCGFQRSVLLLLKGEVMNSFLMFPPLFPMLIALCVLFIGYWTKNKKLKTITWWVMLGVLAFNGIYQNICNTL